jgi:hypothetical protein
MDLHTDPNGGWIGPLVKETKLIKEKEPVVDLDSFRAQLDKYQLPERIRQTVAAINGEFGYQALYLLDFLPPQRSVLRLSFLKNKTEYIMKIVLRTNGPAVVFQSVTGAHGSWRHYIYKVSHAVGSHVAFKQTFMPAKITDEIMRGWFRFHLSGFDKKFKPEMSGWIEIPSEKGMLGQSCHGAKTSCESSD